MNTFSLIKSIPGRKDRTMATVEALDMSIAILQLQTDGWKINDEGKAKFGDETFNVVEVKPA